MWIPIVLTNHGVNTQPPCHIKRLLANDRFRGQRLLCQRRVVTMNFFYNLALHQRLKKMRSEGALVAGIASTVRAK